LHVELPLRLRDLLEVPEGKKVSELERLRMAPRSDSGLAMSKALARVSEVLAIGAGAAQVQAVPVNRVATLPRYGWAGKAPLLKGLAEPRKTATLLATVRRLEAAAVDDVLDLFGCWPNICRWGCTGRHGPADRGPGPAAGPATPPGGSEAPG
jgi:hypothetical protein